MKTVITLEDCRQARVVMLEVRCEKCDRYGRLRLDKLIDEHGAEMALPHLVRVLSADCSSRQ